MKLLIFHPGVWDVDQYKKFFPLIETLNHELIGFTSINPEDSFKMFEDYTVYPADSVIMLNFDKVLIGDFKLGNIEGFKQIFIDMGIPAGKISGIYWLLQQVMIEKYEDIQDPAI